jgi:hypothetical protein
MARTATELATAVLKELRVIRRNDAAASAADSTFVTDKYYDLLQELESQEVAYWEYDDIPNEVFTALVKAVAGECAQAFGTEYDASDAFRRLCVLSGEKATGLPTPAEYF